MNILYAGAIIKGPSNITYIPYLIPLPIKLICNVIGKPSWIVNGSVYSLSNLTDGALPGHNRTGTDILVNRPVHNTEYICQSATNGSETLSVRLILLLLVRKYAFVIILSSFVAL